MSREFLGVENSQQKPGNDGNDGNDGMTQMTEMTAVIFSGGKSLADETELTLDRQEGNSQQGMDSILSSKL